MKSMILETVPLAKVVVCMITGIVVREYLPLALPLLPIFLGLVVMAVLLWKYELFQSLAIAACFMVLGMLLLERQKEQLDVSWPEREVCYEAVVLSSPVEKPKTMAVDILLPENQQKLKCYFYKDERSKSLQVGDGLFIQSRIKENTGWHNGHFNYRRYLEIRGFTGNTFVASWKWKKATVSLKSLPRIERARLYFLKLRSKLLQRFATQGLSEERYAVVAAMVLGDKSALTKDLKETYSVTGASHVLALSGLHLGIIYVLFSLLVVGRRWRMVSQVLIVLSVWAFVFLVGMSVSVVRSAMMLSVYSLLSLGNRDRMSVNTLAFTAIIMLMVNPLSLFDVGFQMSFLAVFSILIWLPVFDGVFSGKYLMSHRVIGWCWGVVAVSCAAQIGVAPLIAYYFGRFSTYFLLTNFIVIPATTLILYLSFMVLLLPPLAYLLIYIVGKLNFVLSQIATIPGASIDGLHPSILQVVMVYVIIIAVWLLMIRFRKPSYM